MMSDTPGNQQLSDVLEARFWQGLQSHQQGRLEEAREVYQQILAVWPAHFDSLHLLGVIALQTGNPRLAIELIQQAISINPQSADSYNNLASGWVELNDFERALDNYAKALAIRPDYLDAQLNRAEVLKQCGRFAEALQDYQQASMLAPTNAGIYCKQGDLLASLNRLEEALVCYDRALELQPDNAVIHYNRGNWLYALKRHQQAVSSYQIALQYAPEDLEIYNNLGNVLLELDRDEEARSYYHQALALRPDITFIHVNLGNALFKLERYQEALASYYYALEQYQQSGLQQEAGSPVLSEQSQQDWTALQADLYGKCASLLKKINQPDQALSLYDQALSLYEQMSSSSEQRLLLQSKQAMIYYQRGNLLYGMGRLQDAITSYQQARQLSPGEALTHNNLGNVLLELNHDEDALACYDRALELTPDSGLIHSNRGNALFKLRHNEEALASYQRGLELGPASAITYNNLGNLLLNSQHYQEALESYNKAIELQPDDIRTYNNRGSLFNMLNLFTEALHDYQTVLAADPDYEYMFGTYLHTKMKLCCWDSLTENLNRYVESVCQRKRITHPFSALALVDDPAIHLIAAEIAIASFPVVEDQRLPIAALPAERKIRIGYYSSDFREHATSHLIAELFEQHNRSRFELYGFYFGPEVEEDLHLRVVQAFDHFLPVGSHSDQEVVQLSRERGIDIAIDLMGHIKYSRPQIFIKRCAPLQVNYLGYPGTTGIKAMDYILADHQVMPADNRPFFSEKVIYLPHCYQVNQSDKQIASIPLSKQAEGLPAVGFVFCSFNQNYKIMPEMFSCWMEILKAVEGSVLWLFESHPVTAQNLRQAAEERGVAGSRLVFASHRPIAEHLARHRLADLFLDTLPYNAHTTASDALWVGLPLLTCQGRAFASRVAASLLQTLGLPELITDNYQDYQTKAIELAIQPEQLQGLKHRLAKNRLRSPLFNTRLFAHHIEAAYEAIYDRHQRGLAPEMIEIAPLDLGSLDIS